MVQSVEKGIAIFNTWTRCKHLIRAKEGRKISGWKGKMRGRVTRLLNPFF